MDSCTGNWMHKSQVGSAGRNELLVLERERAVDGMTEPAEASHEPGDVVSIPPLVELTAGRAQARNQVDHGRLVAPRRDVIPELAEHVAGLGLPVDDQLAGLGQGEHDPHEVPLVGRKVDHRREQPGLRLVPRQVLPRRAEEVGRRRVHARQEALRPLGNVGAGGVARGPDRVAGQLDEMQPLDGIEVQHPGERVEHVDAHVDRPALLHPRVPTDGDTGEHRHFLASEAGRAPTGAVGQADVAGPHGGAARREELPELVA